MKTTTLTLFNIKHTTLIVAVMCMLLSTLFIPTYKAEAVTNAEMLLQIEQLEAVVAALQVQATEPIVSNAVSSDNASPIETGLNVKTTAPLKVRGAPHGAGVLYGSQPVNTTGTIVDGPRYANGYTWWKVDYATGPDGWSAGKWLESMSNSIVSNLDDEDELVQALLSQADSLLEQVDTLLDEDSKKEDAVHGHATAKYLDSKVRLDTNAQHTDDDDVGKFTIDFSLNALDADLTLNKVIDRIGISASALPVIRYSIYDADGYVVQDGEADESLTSSAAFRNGGFLVKKGETETFTFTVEFDPEESGTYYLFLDTIHYTYDNNGQEAVTCVYLESSTDDLDIGDADDIREAREQSESETALAEEILETDDDFYELRFVILYLWDYRDMSDVAAMYDTAYAHLDEAFDDFTAEKYNDAEKSLKKSQDAGQEIATLVLGYLEKYDLRIEDLISYAPTNTNYSGAVLGAATSDVDIALQNVLQDLEHVLSSF